MAFEEQFQPIMQLITSFQSMFITMFIFAIAALVIIFALLRILDGRYPRIRFLVMERGRFWFAMRRLDRIKIVPDDIFQLILTKKPSGDDINAYPNVYTGNGTLYLATMCGSVMSPMQLDFDAMVEREVKIYGQNGEVIRTEKRMMPRMIPAEVINGARIGARYREAQIATEELTLAQQPLLVAIAVSLPIAVICGVYLLAIWLSYSAATDIVGKTAGQLTIMMNNQAAITSAQATISSSMNQTAIMMNSTATTLLQAVK